MDEERKVSSFRTACTVRPIERKSIEIGLCFMRVEVGRLVKR